MDWYTLRTTRQATPVLYSPSEEFPVGGCKILRRSDKDVATIVAAGITLHEALYAYETLAGEGIFIRVIDLYSIKPIDISTLQESAAQTHAVITVEDHFAEGGLGEAVMSALAQSATPVYSLAVRKMPKSGKPQELLDYEEISYQAHYQYGEETAVKPNPEDFTLTTPLSAHRFQEAISILKVQMLFSIGFRFVLDLIRSSGLLNRHLHCAFDFFEHSCIAENLSYEIHIACRDGINPSADRGRTEEERECISGWPVAYVANFYFGGCGFIKLHLNRNLKIEFVTPFFRRCLDRKGFENCLRSPGLRQLSK